MDENTATTSSTSKIICISPSDFDHSRVVIEDADTYEFSVGDTKIRTTTSAGFYLDDDGEKCILYIAPPTQHCFGVSYTYPIGTKKEEQTPENAKGLQVMYQLTSLQTVENPTEEENAYIETLKSLHNTAVEKGREEAELEEPRIPQVSVNSFVAAEKKKNWNNAVKLPFDYPKIKGTKTVDPTKPLRQYLKLVTKGNGSDMTISTKCFGPGDKRTSPLRYIDTRGYIQPCIIWEGIYWGAHGTSPQGASLRFKVVEFNFTPSSGGSSVPSQRLLSRNTSESVEEFDAQNDSHQNSYTRPGFENEGFEAPGGDSTHPVRSLETTKKQVKKTTKSPTKTPAKTVKKPVKTVAKKPVKVVPKKIAKKPEPPPSDEEIEEDEE
jgi:hypothetical protein